MGIRRSSQPGVPHGLLRRVLVASPAGEEGRLPRQPVQSRSPTFERLAALGYVDATFDPDAHLRGVIGQDPDRVFPGLNFYNSRTARSARLIDMEGGVAHEWSHETAGAWQSAELLPGGRVLVIQKNRELLLLDDRSRPIWSFEGSVHHDLDVFEDRIYVLNRREELRPEIHPERPRWTPPVRWCGPSSTPTSTRPGTARPCGG